MKSILLPAVLTLALQAVRSEEQHSFQLHGSAWSDFGRIMHVSDTIIAGSQTINTLDLTGNEIQSIGAQFTLFSELSEHVDGAFGFGTFRATQSIGHGKNAFLTISLFESFLTESWLRWYAGERTNPALSLTIGSFAYDYNPDVKDLGLYLLRGPVYPGILMGGFQDPTADSTKSNILGLKAHGSLGNLSADILLNSEREIPPTLDWSLAAVAKYKIAGALELGAGVNFYRLIPYDSRLETPGHLSDAQLSFNKAAYIDVDSATGDTTFYTSQGTKVMGMFSFDPKPLFGGSESMSPDDLKLYGEVAILGIKNYGKAYNSLSRRIPVMAGINLPTFKILDHLSVEVEYYRALYRNDLAQVGYDNLVAPWMIQNHPIPSPKPVDYATYGINPDGSWANQALIPGNVTGTLMDKEHLTSDDFKWAVYADKIISHHIKFIGQIADDHYRPRSQATSVITSEGGRAEALSSLKDWYFMLRAGYYF